MNRTDRLYALVEELRAVAPRPRSARQLAGRYEVSTRTIERDILALQEAGVPIYAVAGRCGGYVIDKALTLPPLNFTAAEMVAMAVSLARVEPAPFASALRSALRKVLAVAPATQMAEAAQLMERVRLIGTNGQGGGGPRPPNAGGRGATGGAAPNAGGRGATGGTIPAPGPAAVPGSGEARARRCPPRHGSGPGGRPAHRPAGGTRPSGTSGPACRRRPPARSRGRS